MLNEQRRKDVIFWFAVLGFMAAWSRATYDYVQDMHSSIALNKEYISVMRTENKHRDRLIAQLHAQQLEGGKILRSHEDHMIRHHSSPIAPISFTP